MTLMTYISLSVGSKLVMYPEDILLYRPIISENDYTLLQQDIDALKLEYGVL